MVLGNELAPGANRFCNQSIRINITLEFTNYQSLIFKLSLTVQSYAFYSNYCHQNGLDISTKSHLYINYSFMHIESILVSQAYLPTNDFIY